MMSCNSDDYLGLVVHSKEVVLPLVFDKGPSVLPAVQRLVTEPADKREESLYLLAVNQTGSNKCRGN